MNAAAAEAASPAEEEAPEPEIKPAAKAAKGAEARKARRTAAATGKAHEAGAAQAAEDDANETASLPSIDARAKLRPSDAMRAGALKVLIVRYASENGLPYELADAVVRLESRYNPGARNGTHMGLTQINVRTAQSLGYAGPAAGLLDAETNLRYGLKYLAKAYKLAGGDTCGTILRYQFGHRTQTMTSASRAYCAKVKVITAAAD
ncbi:lytic transglycosylase domain-containing protein [Microvirga ossetica]|uniref:lytic transglycosylase domain-containing protein n=1 Tax=Microvirga ossetica TaxID=1882682 RepID=UPI0013000F51|nr:lytic transglycosylase domain-containing protein [Microvirga ossetica]